MWKVLKSRRLGCFPALGTPTISGDAESESALQSVIPPAPPPPPINSLLMVIPTSKPQCGMVLFWRLRGRIYGELEA